MDATMPDEPTRLAAAYEARMRELQHEMKKRERELAILARVAAKVHGEDDVQRILDIALDEILEQMGLRTAWVFMGQERDRKLHLAAHRGLASAYLEEVKTEGLGECLCPEVFWTGHTMQARNTTQCPRMPHMIEGLRSPVPHACIPLKFEGGSRGVLNVAALPGQPFSEDELRFLETLGYQICLAVERARHLSIERAAYEDLKAAQARIIQSEKMAVMGTFASGLAHEVRNPLNSIGLQLSLLERRMAGFDTKVVKETKEMVGIIRDEIRRLDALVNDFLLLARTNRMTFRPVDVDALVDEVVRLLAPEAAAAKVELTRGHCGGAIPDCSMDPEKIKQVIINLVRNAIEAMEHGGAVRVETGLVEGRACLRVSDTGPGLPEDIDVFQIFVSTKPGGTGLGLSIAQQIVLDHGGEILAETRPGEGAAFTIFLPVLPASTSNSQGSE